jgi:hypothetical protein
VIETRVGFSASRLMRPIFVSIASLLACMLMIFIDAELCADSGWAPPTPAQTEQPSEDLPELPEPTGPIPKWAERINYYRTMAGLKPIRVAPDVSAAAQAHVRYLITNFAAQMRTPDGLGEAAFAEDQSRPGYSREAATVAVNSQVAWGCGDNDVGRQIDRWLAGPFQRVAILNPSLRGAGFGEASANGCWAAALRLLDGVQTVGPYAAAVEFPPDGSAVALGYNPGESPDPLASCPGFPNGAGLPITLQLGRLIPVTLQSGTLTANGRPIGHCTFDAHTYRNPSPAGQEYGRWALRTTSAIVMVPATPLRAGDVYKVSFSVSGQKYSWSFQVREPNN